MKKTCSEQFSILTTPDNIEILNDFYNKNKHLYIDCSTSKIVLGVYFDYPQFSKGAYGSSGQRLNTNNSFKDFKRLVLKENIETCYELW